MGDMGGIGDGRHQDAAAAIFDDFQHYDERRLRELSPDQLATQLRVRRHMYGYLNDIWDLAMHAGNNPLGDRAYDAPAALRDLFGGLVSTVATLERKARAADDPTKESAFY